ncbi:MAG: class I SAM-dependent methyltransferase [bacterium]|nr:class I SAM-dependent methyltransferase [bacterium]
MVTEIKKECKICKSSKLSLLYYHKSKKYLNCDVYNYICLDCAFVGQYPYVEMKKIYKNDYRDTYAPSKQYLEHHRKNVLEKANYILANSEIKSGKVLEIGAAAGLLLKEIEKKGFQCSGIEPTIGFQEYAKNKLKLDVKQGFFTKNIYPENSFDIILIVQTLEHISNSIEFIEELKRIIKDKGIIYIEVPNILKYDNFHWFDPPHVHSYSQETLLYLLQKLGLHILFSEKNKYGISVFCSEYKQAFFNRKVFYNPVEKNYNSQKLVKRIKKHILYLKIKAFLRKKLKIIIELVGFLWNDLVFRIIKNIKACVK